MVGGGMLGGEMGEGVQTKKAVSGCRPWVEGLSGWLWIKARPDLANVERAANPHDGVKGSAVLVKKVPQRAQLLHVRDTGT